LQLFEALLTDEHLTVVRFEFFDETAGGEEFILRTIGLTGASVTAIDQFVGDDAELAEDLAPQLEKVTLNFREMTIEQSGLKVVVSG
jgi:type VI protein secretion system component Hcp